jgi:hypothetical protein
MPAQMIDGRALAAKVREEVAAEVEQLGEVGLATVLVGDDPASHVYITGKHKAATGVGIHANDVRLPADAPEDELLQLLAELNADDAVDGILVQLPLPSHLDEAKVIEAIDPAKDIDGLHPMNAGRLYLGPSASGQMSQRGMRATQTVAPRSISACAAAAVKAWPVRSCTRRTFTSTGSTARPSAKHATASAV